MLRAGHDLETTPETQKGTEQIITAKTTEEEEEVVDIMIRTWRVLSPPVPCTTRNNIPQLLEEARFSSAARRQPQPSPTPPRPPPRRPRLIPSPFCDKRRFWATRIRSEMTGVWATRRWVVLEYPVSTTRTPTGGWDRSRAQHRNCPTRAGSGGWGWLGPRGRGSPSTG